MANIAVWLECPVCEYRFSVPEDHAEKTGKCPKCKVAFDAAQSQLPEKELKHSADETEIPEPILFGRIDDQMEPVPPAIDEDDQPPEPNQKPEPPKETVKPARTLESNPYVQSSKKKTDPNKVLIWVSVCCAVAIGLLIGIPTIASMFFSRSTDPEQVTSNDGNAVNTKKEKTESSKSKSKQPVKSVPNRTVVPLTDAELRSIWSQIAGSIVLVTAIGNLNAERSQTISHGVVVSDDGLIAVNWSSIKDAETIRIKFANADYGAKERWSKPINVTQMVANDAALNLAVLKVDRRTQSIQPRTDSVRFNDRGVVPVLNNLSADEYLRLTKLRPPKIVDTLEPTQKSATTDSGLEMAGTDLLMAHTARVNKNGIGVPIFDDKGKFVAMHVTHDEQSKISLGLSYDSLQTVLGNQLPSPVSVGSTGTPSKKGTNKGADEVAKTDSSSGAAAAPANFQEALDRMIEINWRVEDGSTYPSAVAYAEQLAALNEEEGTADFTRRNQIDEFRKTATESQKRLLFWPLEAIRTQVNSLAVEALSKKSSGWYGFVRVLKPAGLGRRIGEEEAMLGEIVETGSKIYILPGEIEGPFLQNTEWIVFGINDRKVKSDDGILPVVRLAGVKQR